ncbi:MAG: TPM domain-containing protein [Nitrospiraceae bacterium]
MWRRSRQTCAALVGALLVILPAYSVLRALDVPPLTGRVIDPAHVLPPGIATQLDTTLKAHEEKTTNQLVVLIVPSLEGDSLFEFSHRAATQWKLGQKGTDNGALLLIAIKDRKVRIEVGYGLEGALTDARSAQIIRHEIVPRFRAGDIPGGVVAGVDAILKSIEGLYEAPERPAVPATVDDRIGSVLFAILLGVIIGLVLSRVHRVLGPVAGGGIAFLAAPWLAPALLAGAAGLLLVSVFGAISQSPLSASRRGRHGNDDWLWYTTQGGWGGGSFGGSGGGFSGGGGTFGGGGASGDW